MFTILRTSLVLFSLTLLASASSKEDVSRSVDVAPGGKLIVEVDFGTINVSAGADDKVTLEAHRKIDFHNESKEKEYLAAAPVTVTKDGNVVTIRARGQKKHHHWNWSFGHQEMDAKYTVHVPKKFEAGLETDGGEISVTNIAGNLKARTSGGDMAFAHLEGTLDGNTSGGAIEVEDCKGPIDIETSGGDIRVTDGTGGLQAHTSGGRIDVRNFSGDTEVRTSGGNLTLEKISGKLVGKTSGGGIHASIPGAVMGDVKLETSAGNIDLAVPAGAALTIDANTSVGEVKTHLPIEGNDERRDEPREHLHGTLNGGGKSVRLQTSAGNIIIRPTSGEIAKR